jgi:FkbM family methyltransferase
MFNKISILKEQGYHPNVILDIGAYKGYWTSAMQKIYDKCDYLLFEAIDYPELQDYKNNNKVFNVILSDKIKKVDWYQMKNTGDSVFKEKTYHFDTCDVIKRDSIDLDTFIIDNKIEIGFDADIFIKIDCQGSEIPILKGATKLIEKTSFILVEIPLFGQYNEGVPSFLEHIKFMDSIGFVPYDIVDSHYINLFNMQVDMLFINKKHALNYIVNKKLTSRI